ncbi:hypothetical protein [Actinopolymorpha sp. B9G3]|uniref:hypothetical protein n=1 Tax=Actinopolymorpha sp. B9G3 TaxID=3158970 RepID=UPI0032D8B9F0
MRRLRFVLVLALLVLVVTMRFRGMLIGLTVLAVNELLCQLLQLEGPGRSRRSTPRWARWRRLGRWLWSHLIRGDAGPHDRSRALEWQRRLQFLRGMVLPLEWLRRWRQPSPRAGFPTYDRILGEIAWSRYSRRDFDVGLRKRLVEAASVRLEAGHGIDPADPRTEDACRDLLGATTWSLLAPGRPASDARSEPGVDLPTLERMVSSIERLRSGQVAGAGSSGTGSSSTGSSGTGSSSTASSSTGSSTTGSKEGTP